MLRIASMYAAARLMQMRSAAAVSRLRISYSACESRIHRVDFSPPIVGGGLKPTLWFLMREA
jgi:hypothetical protein